MRILLAPDKFKGSLSALEAAEAIHDGFRAVRPDLTFDLAPIADGGEGTAEIFLVTQPGERVEASTCDPLGRPIRASYAWFPEAGLAVIDLSAASGLWRLPPSERDPLAASTAGTGLLMAHAIARGARCLQIALGGSATNDAGLGLAGALGWKFLDEAGQEVAPVPRNFLSIRRLIPPPRPIGARIIALCDVENPLLGPRGASRVFGPQKGADESMVERLAEALRHLSDLSPGQRDVPGAGAAGGAAYGLMTFCGARIESGFEAVAKLLHLDERIAAADLVVTGEGRIDATSLEGKGPGAVLRRARRAGKPCLAFAGEVVPGVEGFDACIPLSDGSLPPGRSMAEAGPLLRRAAERTARRAFVGESDEVILKWPACRHTSE